MRACRASQRLAYGTLLHMAPPTEVTGWSGASLIYERHNGGVLKHPAQPHCQSSEPAGLWQASSKEPSCGVAEPRIEDQLPDLPRTRSRSSRLCRWVKVTTRPRASRSALPIQSVDARLGAVRTRCPRALACTTGMPVAVVRATGRRTSVGRHRHCRHSGCGESGNAEVSGPLHSRAQPP